MRILYFTVLALACSAAVSGQTVPSAIYTDPPADAKHPAAMTALHIPSHGLLINGVCILRRERDRTRQSLSATACQEMRRISILRKRFVVPAGMR